MLMHYSLNDFQNVMVIVIGVIQATHNYISD